MFRLEVRKLTDEEVEEIRSGVEAGMRGPVMLKWCEMLLGDHDARVAEDRKASGAE